MNGNCAKRVLKNGFIMQKTIENIVLIICLLVVLIICYKTYKIYKK